MSPGDRFCGSCGQSVTPSDGIAGTAVPAGDMTWALVVERLREALTGEFDIEGELGRGGMAAVFRARELALNRRVAIKVMAPGLLLGEGMVERFRQEAVTIANLQHANIIGVHSVRTLDDLHLFVMQYVPGRSLDRVIHEWGRLSLASTGAVLYHVGAALDYAHRRGVVHRDVKPGNILLDADGDPIVTDFGIAKVTEAPGYTLVGTVLGTPTYMSPEQCMALEVGPPSDQYALGVVAYQMLAGHPPFTGDPMAVMRAHTSEAPPPLRAVRPDVPEHVEGAIMRMLAKKPEDRFPDLAAASEACAALPLGSLGPVRAEMSALAAAADAEGRLAEIVRHRPAATPRAEVSPAPSPSPAGRGRDKPVRGAIASIDIEQPTATIEVGECIVLHATPRTESGAAAESARVTWESSHPDVAAVDAAGVVTAKAVGTAAITAGAGRERSRVDIVVVAPEVATIAVDVPSEVRAGTRTPLGARALDRHGRSMATPVRWVSRNPAIASVTGDGTLSAKRRGVAVLVAESGGVARAATIVVMPPPVVAVVIDGATPPLVVGTATSLRAIARMAARAESVDQERTFEWRSSDPAIATVSAGGTVTARKPGRVTISATCEGVRGQVEVTVVTVRAHSIVVKSPPSPLRRGDTAALSASVYDAAGSVLERPVAWRSSDPRVVSVDQQGRIVARDEGWAIVTAQADGIESPVEIVVRQVIVPTSQSARRESRSLAMRWWVFLAIIAATVAAGWRFLLR
ncbi:MAG TPA: Ig-like domain-containing protein [Gemmatimonadaceae bacterium]|nr:Ig-like domain-containing protein [Gemmatimonadaceae bacterium]